MSLYRELQCSNILSHMDHYYAVILFIYSKCDGASVCLIFGTMAVLYLYVYCLVVTFSDCDDCDRCEGGSQVTEQQSLCSEEVWTVDRTFTQESAVHLLL